MPNRTKCIPLASLVCFEARPRRVGPVLLVVNSWEAPTHAFEHRHLGGVVFEVGARSKHACAPACLFVSYWGATKGGGGCHSLANVNGGGIVCELLGRRCWGVRGREFVVRGVELRPLAGW
jgi:hypothetical protein